MSRRQNHFNWPLILMVFFGVVALFFIGRHRLVIDTDLVSSLPQNDPIVSDARYVISRHPLQDRVVIDLGQRSSDPELLITGGEFVEKRLAESGLFKSVGLTRQQQLFPELLAYVIRHFPVLFSEQDLKERLRLSSPRRKFAGPSWRPIKS